MLRSFAWVLKLLHRYLVLSLLLLATQATARITVVGRDASDYVVEQTGKAWAVVLGIDGYQYAPRLRYAVNDAREMARVLTGQGFQTTMLYDSQATRRAIVSELGGKLVKK